MIVDEILKALLLSAVFLTIFIGMENAKRKLNLSSEFTRRFAHVVSGILAIVDYLLLQRLTVFIMLLTGLAFILVSYRTKLFTSIHNVARPTLGEIYLPLGQLSAFLVSLLNPNVFIPAVLVITFADAFSGLTSDLLNLKRKSNRGSAIFLLTSIGILMFFKSKPWYFTLGCALLLTLVERFSKRGSDNLTVPTVAALLLL